ncbi:MAG: TIR domain-containing protein, partial [Burkholderiales bacterium]
MTDVFLSYSRRDFEFVRKLARALTDREFTVWVDWEGIAPTAAWLADIQRAIEEADHFVFVISPDAVSSEICALELAHAVEHHKRLIPVRLRSVDPRLLPKLLAEKQWVEIAENEPFDAAMERLATAILTDPEAVHGHTRLLTRALEWRSRKGERSLLLRGTDLGEAERWLQGNPLNPAPTDLQREFIAESRRATIRLRRLVATVGSVAVLALAITGAYYLRERERAREQGLAALSRATAAQALVEQGQAYDLALLLAVEAHAISPTLEADSALQRILLSKPRLERILATPAVETVGLRFSRDGSRLAAGFGDGSARVWALEEVVRAVQLAKDLASPASAYAFDADLGLSAVGGGERENVTLRRLPGGELLPPANPGDRFQVLELRVSTDGRFLASANGTRSAGVTLWNLTSGTRKGSPLVSDGGLAAVGFSPDGKHLAAGGWSEHISVWEVDSGRLLQQRRLEGGAMTSGISLAPGWLAAANGTIQLFDLKRPDDGPARIIKSAAAGVRSVAFDPAGRWLAAGSDSGVTQLWDMTSTASPGELLAAPGSYVDELDFSSDGSLLATGGYGQPVRIYATGTLSRFGRLLGQQAESVAAVRVSPDGKRYAAAGRDRKIDLWSMPARSRERLSGHRSDVRALAFTPDGATLVSADARVLPSASARIDVLRWDLRSSPVRLEGAPPEPVRLEGIWSMFPDLPALRDTPWPVAFDAGARVLARPALGPGGQTMIEIVAVGDQRILATLESGFQHTLLALALSADGRRLAAAAADGRYEVWNVDGPRPLLAAQLGDRASCNAVALSPDGNLFAAACGRQLAIHSLDQGVQRLALIDQSSPIEVLAFDPEGHRLAVANSDSTWTLWDVSAARTLGTAFPAPAVIRAMAFANDGKQLLTGDWQGRVIVWDVALADWRTQACRIAGRELTADEWRRYLPE